MRYFRLVPLLFLLVLANPAAAQRQLLLEGIEVRPPEARELVLRLLALQPGEGIEATTVAAAKLRLESSGSFDSVEVYSERGSATGTLRLIVDADLDRGLHLQTGLGHRPISGWYFDLIGGRWNNPLRRGGHLEFSMRNGQRQSGFYGNWRVPQLIFGADARVELSAMEQQWRMHFEKGVYDKPIRRNHLLLGLEWRPPSQWATTLWLGSTYVKPLSEIEAITGKRDSEVEQLLPQNQNSRRLATFGLDFRLDEREPSRSWYEGYFSALQLRHYRDVEEALAFWQVDAEAAVALPSFGGSAFALRGKFAGISDEAPYYMRPTLGGTGSVRGFRDSSLSGLAGTKSTLVGSVEWRTPLVGSDPSSARIIGVLFADAGRVSNSPRDFDVGIGYGLRVRVPWISVFSIDAGIPLSESLTDDPFWVHSSLSFGF